MRPITYNQIKYLANDVVYLYIFKFIDGKYVCLNCCFKPITYNQIKHVANDVVYLYIFKFIDGKYICLNCCFNH